MSESENFALPEQGENGVKLTKGEVLALLPYKEGVLNIEEVELNIEEGGATAILPTKQEHFASYMKDESVLPAYEMILAVNSLTQVLYRKMNGLGADTEMPFTMGQVISKKPVENREPLPILKIDLRLNPSREGVPAVQSVAMIEDENGEEVFRCKLTLGTGQESSF